MGKNKKKQQNQQTQNPQGGNTRNASRSNQEDKTAHNPNEKTQPAAKKNVETSSLPSSSGSSETKLPIVNPNENTKTMAEDNVASTSKASSSGDVTKKKSKDLREKTEQELLEEAEKKRLWEEKKKAKKRPKTIDTDQGALSSQIQSVSLTDNKPTTSSLALSGSQQQILSQTASKGIITQTSSTEQTKQEQEFKSTIVKKKEPMIFPKRGSLGQTFTVATNYLDLNLDRMPDTAYQYDVKIQFYNADPEKMKEPPKKFLRPVFRTYAQQMWPEYHMAYDGVASAYSAVKLPQKELQQKGTSPITVVTENREIHFVVNFKATNNVVDLSALKKYKANRIFEKPMKALQCIEVVLATPCHERGIRAGRSFFVEPSDNQTVVGCYKIYNGLYQAAILGDNPFLNVDVTHKSFPMPIALKNLWVKCNKNKMEMNNFLKGFNVLYTPPNCFNSTPKNYKFNEVLEASDVQTFVLDEVKITVANYFKKKKAPLKEPYLPCVHVGDPKKNIYIPMELLFLPKDQAILRKEGPAEVRKMIEIAVVSTVDRKKKIETLLKHFVDNNHPVLRKFGISIGNQFIKVDARKLNVPKIEYSGKKIVEITDPGVWRKQFVLFYKTCTTETKWSIINYSNLDEMKLNRFVDNVERNSRNDKMKLKYVRLESKNMDLFECLQTAKKSGIGLVFVILRDDNLDTYSSVKRVAETQCGVVTQCVKASTVYNSYKDMYISPTTLSNILMKVNAKLNGSNHKISEESKIDIEKKKRVMFVGADVTHPSPLQKNIPSIVGVVASHDADGTQYNMQFRLQDPKKEIITDMEDIFTEHLKVYKEKMGNYPETVIYYRDGVSDGQFKIIEDEEVRLMRSACKRAKIKEINFTVIVAVKRHHTRFFPDDKGRDHDGSKNINVKAGTVVDTKIIHPAEKQFFMVSHKAIKGTARPTRYNVLVDDSKIPIDDLQTLTYNMCHLFPRCNRAVSYPAPAYLSHLVGLRGRAYIHGCDLNLEELGKENQKYGISQNLKKSNPMHFV